MPFRPNTPGTIILTAGTALLILATISTPIFNSFYFLNLQLTSNIPAIPLQAHITFGTFGYCIQLESQQACSSPKLSYQLNPNTIGITLPPQIDLSSVNPIIAKLTYALILHPIAAALALLSVLSGLLSHFREYSRSCYASCFASLASTVALLAVVFDLVAFSIAKNRLNALSNQFVTANALFGVAIWITLAGWICLTLSGFFFCAGRCLLSRRHRQQTQADQLRPKPDQDYTKQMRDDAHEAEKARQDAFASQNNLPAFAEYHNNNHIHQEHIPLNQFNQQQQQPHHHHHHEDEASSDQQLLPHDAYPSITLNGVGRGYHHPSPPPQQLAHHMSVSSRPSIYSDTGSNSYHRSAVNSFIPPVPPLPSHTMPAPEQGIYSNLPPHVSPASNTMNTPHRPASSIPYRRLPQSLIPGGGMANASRSNSYISGLAPSSSTLSSPLSASPRMPYPSYERALQPLENQQEDLGYTDQPLSSENLVDKQHSTRQSTLDSTAVYSDYSPPTDHFPGRQVTLESNLDPALDGYVSGPPPALPLPNPHDYYNSFPGMAAHTDLPYSERIVADEPPPISPAQDHHQPQAHPFPHDPHT